MHVTLTGRLVTVTDTEKNHIKLVSFVPAATPSQRAVALAADAARKFAELVAARPKTGRVSFVRSPSQPDGFAEPQAGGVVDEGAKKEPRGSSIPKSKSAMSLSSLVQQVMASSAAVPGIAAPQADSGDPGASQAASKPASSASSPRKRSQTTTAVGTIPHAPPSRVAHPPPPGIPRARTFRKAASTKDLSNKVSVPSGPAPKTSEPDAKLVRTAGRASVVSSDGELNHDIEGDGGVEGDRTLAGGGMRQGGAEGGSDSDRPMKKSTSVPAFLHARRHPRSDSEDEQQQEASRVRDDKILAALRVAMAPRASDPGRPPTTVTTAPRPVSDVKQDAQRGASKMESFLSAFRAAHTGARRSDDKPNSGASSSLLTKAAALANGSVNGSSPPEKSSSSRPGSGTRGTGSSGSVVLPPLAPASEPHRRPPIPRDPSREKERIGGGADAERRPYKRSLSDESLKKFSSLIPPSRVELPAKPKTSGNGFARPEQPYVVLNLPEHVRDKIERGRRASQESQGSGADQGSGNESATRTIPRSVSTSAVALLRAPSSELLKIPVSVPRVPPPAPPNVARLSDASRPPGNPPPSRPKLPCI